MKAGEIKEKAQKYWQEYYDQEEGIIDAITLATKIVADYESQIEKEREDRIKGTTILDEVREVLTELNKNQIDVDTAMYYIQSDLEKERELSFKIANHILDNKHTLTDRSLLKMCYQLTQTKEDASNTNK